MNEHETKKNAAVYVQVKANERRVCVYFLKDE